MKKLALIIVLMIGTVGFASARSQNIISLYTKIDTLVVPDKITLEITLSTEKGAGRKGLEDAQQKLYSTLKGLGIDIAQSVHVKTMGSTYSEKGKDTELSQSYALITNSTITSQRVIMACREQNIAVRTESLELSNEKEVELELLQRAILEAKAEAELMAGTIGQKIGKAVRMNKDRYSSNRQEFVLVAYGKADKSALMQGSDDNTEKIEQKIRISTSINIDFLLE